MQADLHSTFEYRGSAASGGPPGRGIVMLESVEGTSGREGRRNRGNASARTSALGGDSRPEPGEDPSDAEDAPFDLGSADPFVDVSEYGDLGRSRPPFGTGLRVRVGAGVDPRITAAVAEAPSLVLAPAEEPCDVLLCAADLPPPSPIDGPTVVAIGDPAGADPGWLEAEVHLWASADELVRELEERVVRAYAAQVVGRTDPAEARGLWLGAVRVVTGADTVARVGRSGAAWAGSRQGVTSLHALGPVISAARGGLVAVPSAELLAERFGVVEPAVDAVVALPLGPRARDGVLVAWVAAGGAGWIRGAVAELNAISAHVQRVTGNRRAMLAELGRRRAEKVLFRALDVVSHDLRSPLFAVQLGVKLLERQHGQSEEIAAIQRTVQTATRIIQRLVHAGRQLLEAPSVPPAGEGADLREAWDRSFEAARRQWPEAVVTGEIPVQLRVAVAPAVVSQLCGVLLDNALRHGRGAGGVKVSASASGDHVRLELRNPGQLPFADSDRIEAFEYRSNGGLGLGLFNARRMAAASGVTVNVRQDGPEVVALVVLPAGEPAAERPPIAIVG